MGATIGARGMQPTTPRDFLKVALQRLTAAEDIMDKLRLSLEVNLVPSHCGSRTLQGLTPEPLDPGTLLDTKKQTRPLVE